MTSQSGFVLQSLSRATLKYDKSPSFRIVFSLRDDSLYLLERSSAKDSSLKTNRYNLRALDEKSALDVITKPSPGFSQIKRLVKYLKDWPTTNMMTIEWWNHSPKFWTPFILIDGLN